MEPIRLVIVEDDPMVMEVNAEFVSRIDGYEVVGRARSGAEAYQVIAQTGPDLVLLDYFLPDTDGLSILRELRKQDLPIDVILVTANRDPDHIKQILRHGAIDYVLKPFRFERIQTAFDQYKMTRHTLQKNQQVEQSDLDIITGIRPTAEAAGKNTALANGNSPKTTWANGVLPKASDLPKGLNDRTLQQILNFIGQQQQAMSAEDVAAGTGLARVTARRYLEYLEKIGFIQLEVQYGSIGRPVNRYKQ